jgi:hypothetical protein
MRLWVGLFPLIAACGTVQQSWPHEQDSMGGDTAVDSGGTGGARDIVLAPDSQSLPVCETASLEVAGAGGSTENWASQQLLFPTSWQTFRGYAMRGPIDALTGIWTTGPISAPFEEREVRAVSSALIASAGQLRCAAGERRALRNGSYAALELQGLGALTCSGEVVPGELRYCHDCYLGDYALTGTLEGEAVREVTGSHERIGDTLFLQVGWGVLIAHFAPDASGERLRDGAYLSFSNQVYCFDAASGDATDIGSADVTFSGFRRADPCEAESTDSIARACVKQFKLGQDW